jgi:2-phosphosulfolactate phosphatase
MPYLRVHLVPDLVEPAELSAARAVVVDVLRATTTIVHALAAGARAIIPCREIDESRRLAATFPPGEVLLGGERAGLPIEGFQLGNSPAEYTPEIVAGKTVVLTTTNGTRALVHCRCASEILSGAFVNLGALCAYLTHGDSPDVDVVCAGTEGRVTWDDVLVAGAVADHLARAGWQIDDGGQISRAAWQAIAGSAAGRELQDRLVSALRASRGGRNLVAIGMADDIALAAEIDRFVLVPRFDPAAGRVAAAL